MDKKILHFIDSIESGGLENGIVYSVNMLNNDVFESND